MRDEVDAIDFILAEALGKSLAEIRDLSNYEIEEWRAWHQVRNAKNNPAKSYRRK